MKNYYKIAVALIALLPLSLWGQTYTFTSAGVTGRSGPTQGQVTTAYTATNLDGMVTVNTQGIQEWVVPVTGDYSIETFGASGGNHITYAGHGAQVYGEVTLTMGTTLYILVGQMGSQHATGSTASDGGGGGTFVTDGTNLLVASGGGGGSAQNTNASQNASLTQSVANGNTAQFGSKGAGYTLNGTHFTYSTYTTVAQSFINNGAGQAGGQASGWPGSDFGDGGFGGGGSACSCSTGGGGGGGGYLGGGGGTNSPYISGFGGSSYMIGTAVNVTSSVIPSIGDGHIVITQLCTPLNVTIAASTLCDGETTNLAAVSTQGGTVTWDNGVVDGVTFTPPVGVNTYTATSSHPDDCPYPVIVTVNDVPTIDGGSDINLCNNGATATLTATGNADTYSWNNGVVDGVSFVPPNGVTTYTLTGEFTATGCTSTDDVVVNVASSMIVAGTTSNEIYGGDGWIDLFVTGGALPLTYSWDNGLGVVEDPSNLSPGTYTVTVTDAIGCFQTATYIIISVVGIDENALELSAYPNPTTGELNLALNGQFDYTVFNTIGQVILTGSALDKELVDLSRFDNGTYILKIINEETTSTLHIVKQ